MAAILLVDDHPLFREGVISAFARMAPDIAITSAETAVGGLLVLVNDPGIDLVLLDIVLPDMDGVDAMARYAAQSPHVPRVLISGRSDPATVNRARRAGASGFLPKALPADDMLAALRRILDGDSFFPAVVNPDDNAHEFTTRQIEVLTLLGDGKTNQQIGHSLAITERTVRAHITELFHHLGVTNRTQAIVAARKRGLLSGS